MLENKVDLHLIAEIQLGNKQAFNALVLKYQYKIFKIISRYINDPSEVLDVAQETFIKAYKAISQFRGDSAFYTWLYRIAVNTAKNHLISRNKKFFEFNFEAVGNKAWKRTSLGNQQGGFFQASPNCVQISWLEDY